MLVEKRGLLQRVRTVLTALVVLAGLGTTLMAMKPSGNDPQYKYGVSETAGGEHWMVEKNVTNRTENPYRCESSNTACTVLIDDAGLIPGDLIEKSDVSSDFQEPGEFITE